MIGAPALVLFDLDGTLVDSAPDLAAAVDCAMLAAGLAVVGEPQVRDYIGDGARRLVHRAITAELDGVADDEIFAQVYASFLDEYANNVFARSRVYPGVRETLLELARLGWRMALITNKPQQFTARVLEAAGLASFFELVLSGDSLCRKKPDPAPLLHAVTVCDVALARTVMVGDSTTDMLAARDADIAAIGVAYGYSGGADLSAHGAQAVIARFTDLPRELQRLLGAAAR